MTPDTSKARDLSLRSLIEEARKALVGDKKLLHKKSELCEKCNVARLLDKALRFIK